MELTIREDDLTAPEVRALLKEHLADLALIEPTRTERADQGPNRTVYRATRTGRTWIRRWLETPVDHPRDVRDRGDRAPTQRR